MQPAFLFDLDGVIVDSMPLHTAAWKVYLERFQIEPGGLERQMHGRRNDEIVRAYFGDGLSSDEVDRHGAAKESLFREMMSPQFEKYIVPGIGSFLDRHAAAPKAIGTNAEPRNVSFVVDKAQLRGYFHAIVDGMQVSRPKPHPEIYLRAAELLGASPARCIVFEDSPSGVAAARAAGTTVVGVTTTSERLEGAAFHIRDFHDPGLDQWVRRASHMS